MSRPPYGGQGQYYPPAPLANPWHHYRPRKRTGLWITLAVVGAVVVTAAFVIPVGGSGDTPAAESIGNEAGKKDLGSHSVTDPAQYFVKVPAGDVKQYSTDVPGLAPGQITDDQLSKVDPRAFLWAVLKRQGQKQLTDTIDRYYPTPHDYDVNYPLATSTSRSVIDWQARKFVYDSTDIDRDDKVKMDMLSRCVGSGQGPSTRGVFHAADKAFGWPDRWESDTTQDKQCDDRLKPGKEVANSNTTDGFAPAGVSAEAMDKFLSYVDHVPGLIEPGKPTMATGKDGKKYIQVDVRLIPQDAGVGGRLGAAFLNAAFAQTGKSPFDFPYSINIGNGQGFHRRYFLDPATLLPFYCVTKATKPLAMDGTPDPDGKNLREEYTVYQYAWPDRIDPADTQTSGAVPRFPHQALPFDQVKLTEQ